MPKVKDTYPEINDIKSDLDSLKSNVVELTNHIKNDGAAQSQVLKKAALKQVGEIKKGGEKQLKLVEGRVREKPVQSLAAAFAAGLFASLILGRR